MVEGEGRVVAEPKVYNNTKLPLDAIVKLPVVGVCRNEWRQRDVTLRRAGPGLVISTGVSFDQSMVVVAVERDEEHGHTLAAWPRTYVHK